MLNQSFTSFLPLVSLLLTSSHHIESLGPVILSLHLPTSSPAHTLFEPLRVEFSNLLSLVSISYTIPWHHLTPPYLTSPLFPLLFILSSFILFSFAFFVLCSLHPPGNSSFVRLVYCTGCEVRTECCDCIIAILWPQSYDYNPTTIIPWLNCTGQHHHLLCNPSLLFFQYLWYWRRTLSSPQVPYTKVSNY